MTWAAHTARDEGEGGVFPPRNGSRDIYGALPHFVCHLGAEAATFLVKMCVRGLDGDGGNGGCVNSGEKYVSVMTTLLVAGPRLLAYEPTSCRLT